MQLKPGTVMMGVPTTGASQDRCIVCTGPRAVAPHKNEMAQEAFLTGMGAGILALRQPRPMLCIDHETSFRETLAMMGIADEETLKKLGIDYTVAKGHEQVEPVGPRR